MQTFSNFLLLQYHLYEEIVKVILVFSIVLYVFSSSICAF